MPPLNIAATAACVVLALACTWCALACDDHELLIYAGLLLVGVAVAHAPQARQRRVEPPFARSVPAVAPHEAAA
ncbi:MAG: hypothetical protein JNM72_26380 [Deltaproteobacteria bacterium]|nr:hypothetical protein [Deltaproteobacteria bacterium]